ncbi:MAG: rod shape-determining protein [Candidatus Eremiobacteraeota bacterium]|nr:rod shape-determining protein [Candidatus Eremiobacteraeota bacterium]MCW5867906.1 rod shape-determining protein [Candidatus Eremiobacteraeota bacterium]
MLYSESMEGRGLTVTPSWSQRFSWAGVRTWLEAPGFDAAVSVGGSQVSVTGMSKAQAFPALLAFNHRQRCVALGEGARDLEGKEPEGVSIFQPMKGGAVHDPHGAKLLLEQALKRGHWGTAPRLLLAVGADPTALERETWEALGRSVGARQIALTSELLASAIGAGLDVLRPRCHMVLHIGAGRCEVGVIALGSCLAVRRGELAGGQVDESIQEYVRRTYQLLIHRQDAERLKIELAQCSSESELPVSGRHLESGAPLRVTLRANELWPIVEPFHAQWVHLARQFLAEIPVAWVDDIQEQGIHLTGGSTLLYGFSQALRQSTGLTVCQPEKPGDCTSKGLQLILKSPVLRKALFSQLPKPKDDFAPKNLVMQRTSLGWSAAAALMAISLFVSAASANAMGLGGPDPWFGGFSAALNAGLASGQKQPAASRTLNQEEKRQMQRLRSENQRLWRWLAKREMNLRGLEGGTLARVVGRDPHQWLSGVRLNVGSAEGIKRGNLVMAEQGLLGRVVQVDDHSCRVSLCLSPSSKLHGLIANRKAGGVIEGKGIGVMTMNYIDPDAGVKDGDPVVTSGQDGQFPRGLPIGTVRQVHRSNETSFWSAQIIPYVKLDDVSEVMVLP